MKRVGSRFFDGYQAELVPGKDGKGHRRSLVYCGEWRGVAGGQKTLNRVKLLCASVTAGLIAAYFYIGLNPSAGGMDRYVAAPGIVALVPMIFLVIGVVNLLISKEKWERRVYYSGYRRIRNSTVCLLIFISLSFVAECVYIALHPDEFAGEFKYAAGLVFCIACACALLAIQRKYPVVIVEGPRQGTD
jgi:hypothetical protein